MRHLPSVGALPVPPEAVPYIVVKQDNNGTTFVVRDQPIGWLLEYCDHHAESGSRNIGPWSTPPDPTSPPTSSPASSRTRSPLLAAPRSDHPSPSVTHMSTT